MRKPRCGLTPESICGHELIVVCCRVAVSETVCRQCDFAALRFGALTK